MLTNKDMKQETFNQSLEYIVDAQTEGFCSLAIQATSHSDWKQKGNESNLLEVEVMTEDDQVFQYHLVTYMGKELYRYKLYLGYLLKGSYKVIIRNVEVPVCERTMVTIYEVNLTALQLSPFEMLAHQHAPLLYGRNHFSSFDNCYTDTPLALLYSFTELSNDIIEIAYHYVFSHEDEGTPGRLLMSKWGRTLDIEYCYRVKWNSKTSKIVEARYQGPQHEDRAFTGEYVSNSHRPILQTRTTNGNFDHVIDSSYCFSLAPEILWNDQEEPREWFMTYRPDINLVMIKEAERQLTYNEVSMNQIVSPINYLFAFCFTQKDEGNSIIDFVYPLGGKVVSSSHDFYNAMYGYGSYSDSFSNFTIAFEYDDVQSCLSLMRIRLLTGEKITINKIAFYMLRNDGVLHLVHQTNKPIFLTKKAR
ncbi:hypothetical protein ACMGD3_10270 [Lysinibacillus sphaericus]|uniref:hypothetical protein n=1 Tax=Lysinibacillus sphaericus TaxID=1421 RepID=UPI003F7A463A